MPPSLQQQIEWLQAKLGNPDYGDEEYKLGELERLRGYLSAEKGSRRKPTLLTDAGQAQTNRSWKDLPADELIKEAYNLVNRDKSRNATLPPAIYQGQKISPMSALTQRGRGLETEYNQKAAPYQKKINKVLAREQQGLTPQHIGGLAQMLEQGQGNFNKNNAFKALQDRFGAPINAIEPEFLNKANEVTNREAGLSKERMGVLGQKIGNAQGENNQSLVSLLEMLKKGKQQKRSAYVNTAHEFGGQQHAHKNMQIEAEKQKFHEEANAPHQQLAMLQQALTAQGTIPENANITEVMQALQAYGIDPDKLMTEQQNPKAFKGYEGERVASQTPEQLASYEVLEKLHPKTTKSSVYPQYKEALKGLMDESNTIGGQAAKQVPAAVQQQIADLERRAGKMIQERVGGLSNKYVQLNQYGSAAHTSEARRIAEKVNESLAAEKARLIEDALATQAQVAQSGTYNKIKNAAGFGNANTGEFMHSLQNIQGTNKLGNSKFNNNQDENDRIYHNYQTQKLHEWPHMRDAARIGALNDVLPGQEANLKGRLNRHNTAYSEHEKAVSQAQQEYNQLFGIGTDLQNKIGNYEQQAKIKAQQEQQQRDAIAMQQEQQRLAMQNQQRQNVMKKQNNLRNDVASSEDALGPFQWKVENGRIVKIGSKVHPAYLGVKDDFSDLKL